MSIKPKIGCPNCGEHIAAERLPPNRQYRNEYGVDVFACPECNKSFKFEPREYLAMKERMEKGEVPNGFAIEGAKAEQLLTSERMALGNGRTQTVPWWGSAKVFLIIGALLLAYLLIR